MEETHHSSEQQEPKKVSTFQALKDRLNEQMAYLKSLADKTQSSATSALESAKDKMQEFKEQTLDEIEKIKRKAHELTEQTWEQISKTKEQAEIYLLESSRKVHQNTHNYLTKISLPKIYFGIVESHLEYVAHKIAENSKDIFHEKTDEWLLGIVDSVYEFMPLAVRLVLKREQFRHLCLEQKTRLFKLASEFKSQSPDSEPPKLPA